MLKHQTTIGEPRDPFWRLTCRLSEFKDSGVQVPAVCAVPSLWGAAGLAGLGLGLGCASGFIPEALGLGAYDKEETRPGSGVDWGPAEAWRMSLERGLVGGCPGSQRC